MQAAHILHRYVFIQVAGLALVCTRPFFKPVGISLAACLTGRSIDIAFARNSIDEVYKTLKGYREDMDSYHKLWYQEAKELAVKLGVDEKVPRVCSRQTSRSNYRAESPEAYYRQAITIPTLGI